MKMKYVELQVNYRVAGSAEDGFDNIYEDYAVGVKGVAAITANDKNPYSAAYDVAMDDGSVQTIYAPYWAKQVPCEEPALVIPIPPTTSQGVDKWITSCWQSAIMAHSENYTWFNDGSCVCDACGGWAKNSDIGNIRHLVVKGQGPLSGRSCQTGIAWDLLPDADRRDGVADRVEPVKNKVVCEAETVPLEIVQELWDAVAEGRSVLAWEELRDRLKMVGVKVSREEKS